MNSLASRLSTLNSLWKSENFSFSLSPCSLSQNPEFLSQLTFCKRAAKNLVCFAFTLNIWILSFMLYIISSCFLSYNLSIRFLPYFHTHFVIVTCQIRAIFVATISLDYIPN
ncbi:hypothetical protein AHF37_06683 [Paragonimus kellicotti]|nr:hypothetical protein AHF37_06683 [Paragonimus kellicotti]